jgi:hypothetical protein
LNEYNIDEFEKLERDLIPRETKSSRNTMASSSNRVFRLALLTESAANISTIVPMILYPDYVLSWLVKGPAQITPAAKTLTQWFGGLIVLATAPLLLSYPEPSSGESASSVTARRRLTYTSLALSEATLGALSLFQYLTGDSGMTDVALLSTMGMMGSIIGMRAFFLFARPQLMQAQDGLKKSQ